MKLCPQKKWGHLKSQIDVFEDTWGHKLWNLNIWTYTPGPCLSWFLCFRKFIGWLSYVTCSLSDSTVGVLGFLIDLLGRFDFWITLFIFTFFVIFIILILIKLILKFRQLKQIFKKNIQFSWQRHHWTQKRTEKKWHK